MLDYFLTDHLTVIKNLRGKQEQCGSWCVDCYSLRVNVGNGGGGGAGGEF